MKIQEKLDYLANIFNEYNPHDCHFLPFKIADKTKHLIQDKLYSKELTEEEINSLASILESLIQAIEKREEKAIIDAQENISVALENKPWNIMGKKFTLDTKVFISKVNQLLMLNEREALDKISKNSELILGSQKTHGMDAVTSLSQSYFRSYDNAIQACDCVLNPKIVKEIIEQALEAVKTLKISVSDSPMTDIKEMLQESESRLREFHSALIYRINEKIIGSHHLSFDNEENPTKVYLKRNPKHLQKIPTTKNLLNFQIYDAVTANNVTYKSIKDKLNRHEIKEIVLVDTLVEDLKDFVEEMRNDQLTLSMNTMDMIQQELALNVVYQLLWEDEIPVVADGNYA
ncbi:MAG: hypothetical protein MK033_08225 [Candidatus Caenarcaniphilales bacterium]|nr:hypothetical protein [Candidatus Caenarcaniphilales bacterium]